MEDVAVIYKSSPREATPSLQSERITSACRFYRSGPPPSLIQTPARADRLTTSKRTSS